MEEPSNFFGKAEFDRPNGNSKITYFYQFEKLILDHQRATTALAIYLSSGQYNSQAFIDQTADQIRAIIFADTSPGMNPDHTVLLLEATKADSPPKAGLVGEGESINDGSEVSVKVLVIAYVYLTEFDYFKGQSVREQIRTIASMHGKSPNNLYNTYCTFMKNKDWLTPLVVPHLEKAIEVLKGIGLVAPIRRAEADLLHLTSDRR